MPLNELQRAGLRQHLHNTSQIVDDDGNPAEFGGGEGGDGGIPQGGPLTEALDADGFPIQNLGDPEGNADAANKGYVDTKIADELAALTSEDISDLVRDVLTSNNVEDNLGIVDALMPFVSDRDPVDSIGGQWLITGNNGNSTVFVDGEESAVFDENTDSAALTAILKAIDPLYDVDGSITASQQVPGIAIWLVVFGPAIAMSQITPGLNDPDVSEQQAGSEGDTAQSGRLWINTEDYRAFVNARTIDASTWGKIYPLNSIPQGGPFTEELDADGFTISGLPAPEENNQAANKEYVDNEIDALIPLIGAFKATVDIDAADFNNANSVPIELIPAPDPDQIIHVLGFAAQMWGGTFRYGLDSLTFDLVYAADESPFLFRLVALNSIAEQMRVGTALNEGAFDPADIAGQPVVLKTSLNASLVGAIDAHSLGSGGVDYAVSDTFTIAPQGEGDVAQGVVDTVDGNGAVLTYVLSTRGSGFIVADGNPTSNLSGIGTGLAIDVDSLTPPDWKWRITVVYEIFDLAA